MFRIDRKEEHGKSNRGYHVQPAMPGGVKEDGVSAPEPASPLASPCVGLCRMDDGSGLCRGCLRTMAEIIAWGQAGEDVKRAVWAEIRRREALFGLDD
ncbi:MAG TPA: DUF1289 domain-containing protein [Janthinobacterium sp.]|nr:DUF1289 domain-containing protein [Janthinobacterium sp.]